MHSVYMGVFAGFSFYSAALHSDRGTASLPWGSDTAHQAGLELPFSSQSDQARPGCPQTQCSSSQWLHARTQPARQTYVAIQQTE